ncbi:MAG: hypothetical protein ABR530_05280 [Pyrinomonadaceae bacterium]
MQTGNTGRAEMAAGKGNGADMDSIGAGNLGGAAGSKHGQAGNTSSASNPAEVLSSAKETGSKVAESAIGTVKEKANSLVTEQKSSIAVGLTSIAEELRRTGQSLRSQAADNQLVGLGANYGEALAGQVEGISRYLGEKDIRTMASDLENYARRNPALFIGGAFLLGFAATRFVKSSTSAASEGTVGSGSGGRRANRGTNASTTSTQARL